MKIKLLYMVVCVYFFSYGRDQHIPAEITKLLGQYTRPFTLLEICPNDIKYSVQLAQKYPTSVFIILTVGNKTGTINYSVLNKLKNVVLLNVYTLSEPDIKTLSRCEHFDVLLMHDLIITESFCHLADYVVLDNAHAQFRDSSIMHTPKNGIDIPRWSCKVMPESPEPRYPIMSNFREKYCVKNGVRSSWLPGINLITALMLYVSYPSLDLIAKNIKSMKKIDHNDLVIGNMIVQGAVIVPIDFNDKRHFIKVKTCLKAAKRLLKNIKKTHNNEQAINDYHARLMSRKKP
ncbi:MAG: hypothetical protein WC707_03670 [Candidatus Babeliaceae bacterium]|jgi:hypothetical protein